nr:hypothetical protein [Tanacetum cinerariifolium]
MSVYIERKIKEDLYFAARLSHLWEVLYSRVNKHRLLIAELNVFGGPLALQCGEFFKQLSQNKVLKMLEIRKSIAEAHMQIWMIPVSQITEVDPHVGLFVSHIRSVFESDFVSLDPRLKSKKSAMDRSFTLGSIEEADNVKILQSCNGLLQCGDDFGSREFTIYELTIGCSVWMVREQDSFLVIKLFGKVVQYNLISKTLHEIYDCGSNQVDDNHDVNDDDDDDELIQQFQVLDELMEITGSIELDKRMRFWFVQEIAEEEGLLKFLRDRCDDLRRKNTKSRVLIREMEALGEHGVAVDSLESLKQTHTRETAKLVALTYAIAESLAGIHEKERHVAKLDLND